MIFNYTTQVILAMYSEAPKTSSLSLSSSLWGLVTRPGIEPGPLQWGCGHNTGPPGKPQDAMIFLFFFLRNPPGGFCQSRNLMDFDGCLRTSPANPIFPGHLLSAT